jgi:HlyD family secretion protein
MLLKTNRIKADNLKREVDHLRHEIEIETEASKISLEKQLAALHFDVKILNERLQFLDREYKKKLELYREGLIILNIVQDTERQISNTKISLEEKKGEIADAQSKLKQSYRTEELKTKELDLLKAEEDVRVTEATLHLNRIYSEFEGKILEVLVNPGEVVAEGQPLYNVELLSSDESILFYGFFPSELGKHVRKGSIMRMALSTVNEKEYGSILSRVKEVSQYAISEKAILNEFHNADLAKFLSNQQPVTQVIAEPIPDPNDPSKFEWTSRKGPPIDLSTGVVGTVEVTTESVHPIYYLIPVKGWKQTSFGDSL